MWCWCRILLGCTMVALLTSCSESPAPAGWQALAPMKSARAGAAVSSLDNWVYVSGGVDGQRYLRTVERARILEDGTLSAFQYVRLLPEARGFHGSVVYQGYLYLAGGANGPSGGNLLSSVIRAQILTDGSLGPWESAGQDMLLPRRCNKLIVHRGRLVAIGGYAGTLLDQVETGKFDSQGRITNWQMQSAKLDVPRYINAVSYTDDAIYVSGGHQASGGGGITAVERGHWQNGELMWARMPALPQGRYGLGSAWLGERLYTLGGMSGARFFNRVDSWQPGDQVWSPATDLPAAMANFATVVVQEKLYVLGGVTMRDYLPSVYAARLSGNGKLMPLTGQGTPVQFENSGSTPEHSSHLPNTGQVLEVLNSADYVFLYVRNHQGMSEWVAGPPVQLREGQNIQYSDGITMRRFTSKSLNRQFDSIRLVSRLEVLESNR